MHIKAAWHEMRLLNLQALLLDTAPGLLPSAARNWRQLRVAILPSRQEGYGKHRRLHVLLRLGTSQALSLAHLKDIGSLRRRRPGALSLLRPANRHKRAQRLDPLAETARPRFKQRNLFP